MSGRSHPVAVVACVGALLGSLVSARVTSGPRFYPDDPISREPESQDASGVEEWDIELLVDLTMGLFVTPSRAREAVRAGNINTIDEVPDSNWFTNRIGSRPVSIADAVRGPASGTGPASGRWTVTAPKRSGMAPGFTMRDEAGETWFITFDSAGHPEAATGAVMVANKIFWALGYWQVEHYLTSIRRDQVDVAPSATFTPLSQRTRPMRRSDLNEVFARAHRSPDGTFRAVAGRRVPGRAVGGFRYQDTRPDDPNDIVPHEHRRELRALQVFGAWTNLVDMKAGNTLDTVITENGRGVVRHYLQDVGSTFGTGALGPREYDEGWEYLVELDRMRTRLFRLGFPLEPWHTAKYAKNSAIGRFEGQAFEPRHWKPRVPVAALLEARRDDTFWAARRVAAFSDEMIRELVRVAQYSTAADTRLLADILIQRRNKIAAVYLNAINPLVDFELTTAGTVKFRNAAVDAGVGTPPEDGYRATWSLFDNTTDTVTAALGPATFGAGLEIAPPAPLPSEDGTIIKIAIAAQSAAVATWHEPVSVYFRRGAGQWQLVGVDRMTP
jgi:hypothetical protein